MSSHEDLHYELDMTDAMMAGPGKPLKPLRADYCSEAELAEAQWNFHMEQWLMTRSPRLSVPSLQTDGLIFLWVTGRAMELGPEGYFRKLSAKFRYHVISIYMKFGALGVQPSGRDHMGKDKSTSTYNKNRKNRSLAQPSRRAFCLIGIRGNQKSTETLTRI
ncbi:N6-adenosine-methyltransferase MT-A70-like isoform X2 [Raphanus sativus]|uniref:N6-adenosine-methyltransferase MT-A70-like isoform X2 n=1 Tax=Raphanus sativus TaxID=3726 RepID=A0A6J0MR03_RAPSA|nr:N6-adenosine-methyltransferase MT-A70-like isoform X2 [Raphanus sativus]